MSLSYSQSYGFSSSYVWMWELWQIMVNDVGFMISKEVLASGPGTGLITQSFCVAEVLLQWKRTEEVSDIDIRRGMEGAPLNSLIKALYTFTRPTPTTYLLN